MSLRKVHDSNIGDLVSHPNPSSRAGHSTPCSVATVVGPSRATPGSDWFSLDSAPSSLGSGLHLELLLLSSFWAISAELVDDYIRFFGLAVCRQHPIPCPWQFKLRALVQPSARQVRGVHEE